MRRKVVKIIISIIIIIFFVGFVYYVGTRNPSLKRHNTIIKLREAVKITYESKEIDMKYSSELIDIIERSGEELSFRNLPTYENKKIIDFYDASDEIIYSVAFYPDEYEIGISKREKRILEKDRKRFLEIINYINE